MTMGSPSEPVAFGKHYLLGLIARGGMAEVYRGRYVQDVPPRRQLAVKVMRPQLAREERFIDMFHREGKLAMMLKNRCIVETYDVGEVDGRHYITMEYIGGRDLTQVLRRCQETQQRIPVPHAVYIAARIAEGLHFAHSLGAKDGRPLNIVNRDVSPSNVRLSYDGDVKLLDFGIAQALMKFTSEIGILKGKFSYMSPEQIRGMPLDARTDVFSAGIILHEMLTTEKLFRGDTEFALMEKVRKAEVPPPSNFNRTAASYLIGDVIDLGTGGVNKVDGVYLVIGVDTAVTSGGAGTYQFHLCSDAQAAIAADGTATYHFSTSAIPKATLVAGYSIAKVELPIGTYERYLGILQTTAVAAATAGKVNAFLTNDPTAWVAPDAPFQL